ncbi:MAG: MASE1 domain-containing protein [Thermoplasmata archaeon]|nr:MASE1 domain-containing protein [Thermoplasmata archaeon]
MGSSESDGRPPPPGPWYRSSWWRTAAALAVLGIGYFVAGKVGLFLAVGNASVSAVWPPTGIAIAALLLGDSTLWPAIFAGAFLVNLTTTWDVASSLGIASGNTLEAIVGAYLANRFAGGRRMFEQPRSVLVFALLGGFVAATVAATIGTASLTLAHLARPGEFLAVWGPWWLGDAIGAIEVTQHQRLESALYDARKTLQRVLTERTAQLDATVSLATIGTWTFEAGSSKLVWSEEMYRILGYGAARFPVALDTAFARMDPSDQERFLGEVRSVLDAPEAKDVPLPERRYRLVLPEGDGRTLRSQLAVVETTNGRATRIRGMIQDVTERQRLEEELRRLKVASDSGPETKEMSMWMIPWMKEEKS